MCYAMLCAVRVYTIIARQKLIAAIFSTSVSCQSQWTNSINFVYIYSKNDVPALAPHHTYTCPINYTSHLYSIYICCFCDVDWIIERLVIFPHQDRLLNPPPPPLSRQTRRKILKWTLVTHPAKRRIYWKLFYRFMVFVLWTPLEFRQCFWNERKGEKKNRY